VASGVSEFRAFFTGEVEAAAAEIERTDRLPRAVLDGAARLGAYGLTVPPEHGGRGLSTVELVPYLEAAAMGPGAGRMLVHLSNGIWRPIAHYGDERQRALVPGIATGAEVVAFCLTEATGGTGRDLRSRAVRDGDEWVLTGEKHLITFADRAGHFLLVAATDDRAAKDSLTAFLIPRGTPGFGIDATQRTMGLHGTGHAWLRYDGMRVADAHRLGPVGAGLDVGLFFLDYSRVSLSACMVGLGERALDEAARFALRRATFGRPIADRQAIQAHLADMRADIDAGRGLVRRAAELHDAGGDITAAASTAKLFCLNMIGRVTDLALRVHGGFGYSTDAPIERIYRDARGFWFEEGTQEIQQLVVARQVLADAAGADGAAR
jgi:alkylation response protein AidB-like acyl-CoA dehydrogenase